MNKITLIILVLLSLNSFSQNDESYTPINNLAEVQQLLQAHSTKLNTIKSDFIQEKHLAFIDDTIITEGKFWFKKENQLRWEYTTPFSYIIVINNGKFIIKDDEKISEFDIGSNKAFQEVNRLIISSVRGNLLEESQFEIAAFENSSNYLIVLNPMDENMKSVLHKIELNFSKTTLDITKVKMIENEEDYTIISFTNKTLNENIPANIFTVN